MKIFIPAISLLLLALFPVSPATGESTINCHCFQDRTFDAAHPEKIEPYLLATAQSSFLSTVFNVEKAQLVRRRMSGTGGDDLWIAISVGKKRGVPFEDLLAARNREGSWRTALLKSGIKPADLAGAVAAAFKGGTDQVLASAVADESISRHLGISPPELTGLRARGATTQELILAGLLGKRTGRPAKTLWNEVRERKTSWGIVAANSGVEIGNMEGEFARILRKR